jgi:hypothetical protein
LVAEAEVEVEAKRMADNFLVERGPATSCDEWPAGAEGGDVMSGDNAIVSKRSDKSDTSYGLEQGAPRPHLFRDSGELRVTIFGQPVRLDGYRHGSGEAV